MDPAETTHEVGVIRRMPILRDIHDHMDSRRQLHDSQCSSFENVISIMGPRGVGKTTLVRHACDRLGNQGHDVVLDLISPSLLGASGSLINAVLASLSQQIATRCATDCERTSRTHESLFDLQHQLEGLSVSVARTSPGILDSIKRSAVSPDSYAWQVTQTEASNLQWRDQFHRWVDSYLEHLDEGSNRTSLLVLPLDDFDLAPSYLPSVLTEIGSAFDHSRIVLLVAFARPSLERAAAWKLFHQLVGNFGSWRELGIVDTEAMQAEIQQEILKISPLATRITLPEWETASEQLSFSPPGRERRLLDLFGDLAVGSTGTTELDLAMFFDTSRFFGSDGPALIPTRNCALLPTSARGLRDIYFAIERITANGNDSSIERISELVDALVQSSIASAAAADRELLQTCIQRVGEGAFSFDFRQLGRSMTVSQGVNLRGLVGTFASETSFEPIGVRRGQAADDKKAALRELKLRMVNQLSFRTRAQEDEESERPKRGNARTMATAGVARDLVRLGPDTLFDGEWNSLPTFSGAYWDLPCKVLINGEETDNSFIRPVDYSTALPTLIYIEGWNAMVSKLREAMTDSTLSTSEGLAAAGDAVVLAHLYLQFCVLSVRPIVFPNLHDLVSQLVRSTNLRAIDFLAEVRQSLADAISTRINPKVWFQSSIDVLAELCAAAMLACSRAVCTSPMLDFVRTDIVAPLYSEIRSALDDDTLSRLWETLFSRAHHPNTAFSEIAFDDLSYLLVSLEPDGSKAQLDEHYKALELYRSRSTEERLYTARALRQQGAISDEEFRMLVEEGLSPALEVTLAARLNSQLIDLVRRVFSTEGAEKARLTSDSSGTEVSRTE